MSRLSLFEVLSDPQVSLEARIHLLFKKSYIEESSGRRRVFLNGKPELLSRVLWNLYHPDDPVKPGEVVHHKNEKILDDRISNYEKMSRVKHSGLHGKSRGAEALKKANIGRSCSPETRKKIGDPRRGVKLSPEHCMKLSLAKAGVPQKPEHARKRGLAIRDAKAANMKWNPDKALELRSEGMAKRAVARELGVKVWSITDYFNRRGISW